MHPYQWEWISSEICLSTGCPAKLFTLGYLLFYRLLLMQFSKFGMFFEKFRKFATCDSKMSISKWWLPNGFQKWVEANKRAKNQVWRVLLDALYTEYCWRSTFTRTSVTAWLGYCAYCVIANKCILSVTMRLVQMTMIMQKRRNFHFKCDFNFFQEGIDAQQCMWFLIILSAY